MAASLGSVHTGRLYSREIIQFCYDHEIFPEEQFARWPIARLIPHIVFSHKADDHPPKPQLYDFGTRRAVQAERNFFILCFLLELGCEPAKLLRNWRSYGSVHELVSLRRKKLLGRHCNFSNNFKENFNN
jgi:hypothetical protein